jgi:GDP-L-fucose synthase
MPTNLYGPGDNYDLKTSHVVPALIAKAHAAKENGAATLKIWGTGKARREFLHVDEAASALVHLLRHYSDESHINVGAGKDISITDLAELICDVVGFRGALVFDTDLPDGTPRKLLDCSRLSELGWQASMALREGLADAYRFYRRDVLETAVIPETAARRPSVMIGPTTTERVLPGYRQQPIGAK